MRILAIPTHCTSQRFARCRGARGEALSSESRHRHSGHRLFDATAQPGQRPYRRARFQRHPHRRRSELRQLPAIHPDARSRQQARDRSGAGGPHLNRPKPSNTWMRGLRAPPSLQPTPSSSPAAPAPARAPQFGADISHRGGRPGFVRVDGDQLTIPDFAATAISTLSAI